MSHYLTIDQGNTTAKLALWTPAGQLVDTECRMSFVARDVAKVFPGFDIDAAIYCTVSRRPPTMLRALEHRAGRVIEYGVATPMPMSVDYRTPHTLGADRLAAAMGAYSLSDCAGRNLLVVDTGTAITYDRVNPEGCFTGGNIAPGIFMRLKALHHYTARLPLVDPRGRTDTPLWGDDTPSALLAGAVRGVVAELEYYRAMSGNDTVVVLTGGYADMVAGMLSFSPVIEPNLVSLGLFNILKYNIDR